ncbi:serine hydrolase [Gordonia sp. TBRC 11910]|uniref:Serine hydrolase n=2 Tax=Gordonia asplenii TaxID=2725283 RepID=A0A848L183_9ACTN|nr:serine hydrolase [Gordonia asplenii]
MPTTPIIGAGGPPLPASSTPLDLSATVETLSGPASIADVFAGVYTDGLMVVHDGAVVHEEYPGELSPLVHHLVMSVSKSILGATAGVLREQGVLDIDRPVVDYVPEVASGGYAGATVRNVLDMRTGVAFSEEYTNPDAEVRVVERSAGWAPLLDDDPDGLYSYITTLGSSGPHDGDFVYRSIDTDMLGWIIERATGTSTQQLISDLVWKPMGASDDAFVTVDAHGVAMHDGGICATLRDLARFGTMLCNDGAIDGRQVVPTRWIDESFNPGDDVRDAFARTSNEPVLPGGWYRNQFWFVRRGEAKILLCLGIHGQLIYVHPAARTVVAKLSSWPTAQDSTKLIDTLRACGTIADQLAAQ